MKNIPADYLQAKLAEAQADMDAGRYIVLKDEEELTEYFEDIMRRGKGRIKHSSLSQPEIKPAIE